MQNPAVSLEKLREFCEKDKIEIIDLKFIDVPGKWQHLSIPVSQVSECMFTEGIGFDGSSIRGFQTIEESDMVLILDMDTAHRDPFCDIPTLSIIADPMDPSSGIPKEYDMNPRAIARRAVEYLRQSGIADEIYIGPEIEFFIFDDVRFGTDGHYAFYEIDAEEGHWNTEKNMDGGNMGHRPQMQGGYFPVSPVDSHQNLRTAMVLELQRAGMEVEAQHHEVAGPGQSEIDIRFQPLLEQADNVMMYKYIVQNVADRHGKTVTFMPKPLFQHSGSGMHVHQSLWKEGKPLFFDENGYAGLSAMALNYIAGLLGHARAHLAFGASTTNSYKRLTPGYEAPVILTYSKRNRSAAARIPMYNNRPEAKRVEFRSADPLANPYLTFAAMLMAGIDGIKKQMDPGEPHEQNLFHLSTDESAQLSYVPSSLDEALNALEQNHGFLCEGGVFSEMFIKNYIAQKRKNEVDAVRLRPHPHEFVLYYSA